MVRPCVGDLSVSRSRAGSTASATGTEISAFVVSASALKSSSKPPGIVKAFSGSAELGGRGVLAGASAGRFPLASLCISGSATLAGALGV